MKERRAATSASDKKKASSTPNKAAQDHCSPMSEDFSTPETSIKPRRDILSRLLSKKINTTSPNTPAASKYSTPMTSRASKSKAKDESLQKLELNNNDDNKVESKTVDTPAATDYSTPMTSRTTRARARAKDISLEKLNPNNADDTPVPSASSTPNIDQSVKVSLTPIDLSNIDAQSNNTNESEESTGCHTPSRISGKFASEDSPSNDKTPR
jgi:hypothetical protein